MMKKLLLPAALVLTGLLAAAEPVKVRPDEILLLAHFNSEAQPEVGISDGMVCSGAITAGEQGVKFRDSVPRSEALDLTGRGAVLALPGTGNIDVRQGTIQFWFKPRWRKAGYTHCRIFQFGNNPANRGGVNWQGNNTLFFQKSPKIEGVALVHNGKTIQKELPHDRDTWYHATIVWNAATKLFSLYLNGELIGSQPYSTPSAPPEELHLGAPDTHNGQVFLDELRILNRPLNKDEVKQDYAAQRDGNEFPSPATAAGSFPVFEPLPPREAKNDSELLDVTLPVTMVTEPVTIDGNVDKPCYRQAPALPPLIGRKGEAPQATSRIQLLYDRENLYIAARFEEPQMQRIAARFDQRDLGIFNDDCLEFVMLTPGEKENFFHFAINAIGSIYDSRDTLKNWDAKNAVVRNMRGADYWTVEMKLPFRDLGAVPPEIGEIWGARIGRERHGAETQEIATVPQASSGSLSARQFLGKLEFLGPAGAQSAVECTIPADTFLPGANQITLAVKSNADATPGEYQINIISGNRSGSVVDRKSEIVTLKAGESREFPLVFAVGDDEINRVSISVNAPGGVPVYSRILRPGFVPVTPSLRQSAEMLPGYLQNIEAVRHYRHPLYQSTVESVELLKSELAAYDAKLKEAFAQGKTVSESDYARVAAVANGFHHWLENRRYLVWQTSPWENGSPQAIAPLKYNDKMLLKFDQAGNEREAVCLIVSGLLTQKRMDLRFYAEPIKQNNAFISSDNFRIYREEFVDHMGTVISAPLIQVPGNIITVTPGHSQRIWVVFDSRGVKPGNYTGALKIKPLHDYTLPNRELPIALRIFDFALPETRDWPLDCFFWTGQFTPLNEPAMVDLAWDHHIKWVMTESHNYKNGFVNDRDWMGAKKEGRNYDPELAKTANDPFFRRAKELGMRVVFAWGTADDVEWHKLMSDRLKAMGFGYEDFIFHGALRDEFKAEDIPRLAELRKQLRAADPNWQFMATYLTTPPPSGATLEQIKEAGLLDFYKVWSTISTAPKILDTFRKHDRTVWQYRCNLNMQIGDVLNYYRFFPWEGYRKGLDGIAYWSFYSAKGDGFDHRDAYDDGITMRGIDKKPIPTKRLQAVREGLEDVAYMDILKKRIEKAQKQNPARKYDQYLALLNDRVEQIMRNRDQNEIDRWRLDILEAIEQLGK